MNTMNTEEANKYLESLHNDYQHQLDRQARDYDSQIEDMQSQIDALEKANADLKAQSAEDAQIIEDLRKRVEGAVSATHDYQQVAHVQSGVMHSFRQDLEAQRQLNANLKNALHVIARGTVDNCQHFAQAVLDKYFA